MRKGIVVGMTMNRLLLNKCKRWKKKYKKKYVKEK